MLTLSQLAKNTPRPVKGRAKICAHQLVKEHQTKGQLKYLEHQYKVQCTDGPWKTTIRFYPGENEVWPSANQASTVWVSCSCPYWLFYCEVATARTGSSSVIYSNGDLPIVRNPTMVPYLCKHLVTATKYLRRAPLQRHVQEQMELLEQPKRRRGPGRKPVKGPRHKQDEEPEVPPEEVEPEPERPRRRRGPGRKPVKETPKRRGPGRKRMEDVIPEEEPEAPPRRRRPGPRRKSIGAAFALLKAAEQLMGIDEANLASIEDAKSDICRALLQGPASRTVLEDDLLHSAVLMHVGAALKWLVQQRYIRRQGTDFSLTPEGVVWFAQNM